jgi:hypothetical protein
MYSEKVIITPVLEDRTSFKKIGVGISGITRIIIIFESN